MFHAATMMLRRRLVGGYLGIRHRFCRRQGLLTAYFAILLILFTGLLLLNAIIHNNNRPSLLVIDSSANAFVAAIITTSERSPAAINGPDDVLPMGNSTSIGGDDDETTTSSGTTKQVEKPETSQVDFRLISYFDLPVKFRNIPEKIKNNLAAILPVNRYGHFKATLRNRELVILIPTIYRPKESYLAKTIHNLLETITNAERQRIVILVSINDILPKSENVVYSTANSLISEFPTETEDGLIEIIGAPAGFYMDFTQLPSIQDPAIVDTQARLQWRSKQVIDYAFMFSYAFTQQMGKFALLLEDDVIVTENSVVATILSFPNETDDAVGGPSKRLRNSDSSSLTLWYEFCPWGAIGKMFQAKQLPTFVNIMTTIFYVEPVDWQLGHIAEFFACRYFHSRKQCDDARKQFFKVYPRKLFKHVAQISTAPEQPARTIPKGQQ